MTEQKDVNDTNRSGFRIKWGDKEVEYFGDSVKELFSEVFNYIKNAPQQAGSTVVTPPAPPAPVTNEDKQGAISVPLEFDSVYARIANDASLKKEQVMAEIKFEKREGFTELVPILSKHPSVRDAIRLIGYSIQVGTQKTPIEISYLKDLAVKANGYSLPGSEFGIILRDFRKAGAIIASKTQENYMPITFSKKGLDDARLALQKSVAET